MVRVTAALCTYQRYDLLARALESLRRQSLPAADYRILVVDNSPDPEHAAAFGRRFAGEAQLTYLVEPRPGLSNARNVALAACDSEIIAFMDDDAEASPSWLASLLEAFAAVPAAAAVGGRVLPRWGAPRPAWLHQRLLGYLSVVDWGGSRRDAGREEWLAGTNLAFRRDRLRALGGFSLDLGRDGSRDHLLSNEELEIVEQLRAAGDRVLYEPAALVWHLVPPERLTQDWFRRRVAWQALSNHLMRTERSHRREPSSAQHDLLRLEGPRFAPLLEGTSDEGEFLERLYALHALLMAELAAT